MKATHLDNKLLVRLLTAHRETIDKTQIFQLAHIDEQICLLQSNVRAETLRQQGGDHYGAVRHWMQCKAVNGDRVNWGSYDQLQFRNSLTVKGLEDLACTIAAAAINNFKGQA